VWCWSSLLCWAVAERGLAKSGHATPSLGRRFGAVRIHCRVVLLIARHCLCHGLSCLSMPLHHKSWRCHAFATPCPALPLHIAALFRWSTPLLSDALQGLAFAERCGAEPCHAFAIHRCAMHCRCSAMPCCAGLRLCCALRRPAMPLLDETVQVGAIATRQATTPSHQPTAARQQHHVGGRTQTLVWSGNSPCRFS